MKALISFFFCIFILFHQNLTDSTSSSSNSQISVTGTASILASPTDLSISFTVKTTNSEANQALSENNQKMNTIIEEVKALNITEDELGTTDFNIQKEFRSIQTGSRYENVFVGYKVSQTLIITTKKFELSGQIIDRVIARTQDTTVDSVRFFVNNDLKKKIQDQLIEKAVLNAKYKANLGLEALGYEVATIRTMNLDSFNEGSKSQFKSLVEIKEGTTFFAESSEISLSVSVVFSIKKINN